MEMTTNEILWIKAQEACDYEKSWLYFLCIDGVKLNEEIKDEIRFETDRNIKSPLILDPALDRVLFGEKLSDKEYIRAKSIYCLLLIESAGNVKNGGRRLKKS
jgi:hypothetical protein